MNFKVKRQKFGIGPLIFLMLFGAAFTAGGYFAVRASKIDPNWTKVTGKITSSSTNTSDGSTTYAAVVSYTVGGQNYSVTSGISTSVYPHIGDDRQLAYNPAHPDQSKVVSGAGTLGFLYLFPAVGVAILVLAPVLFIKSLRRSRDISQLMQTGQKLQGVLVDVQSSGSSNNSGSMYKLVVSAVDGSGTVQNYVSDQLGGIGGLALMDFRTTPVPIDVYINPTKPSDYYVDVSDVPNLTPGRIAELLKAAACKQPNSLTTTVAPSPPSSTPPVVG